MCELELEEAFLLYTCQKKDESIAWFQRRVLGAEQNDSAFADYFDGPGKEGTWESKLQQKVGQGSGPSPIYAVYKPRQKVVSLGDADFITNLLKNYKILAS